MEAEASGDPNNLTWLSTMRKQAIERVGVDAVENSLKKMILVGKNREISVSLRLFRGEVVTDDFLEVEEGLGKVAVFTDHHGNGEGDLRFLDRSHVDLGEGLGWNVNVYQPDTEAHFDILLCGVEHGCFHDDLELPGETVSIEESVEKTAHDGPDGRENDRVVEEVHEGNVFLAGEGVFLRGQELKGKFKKGLIVEDVTSRFIGFVGANGDIGEVFLDDGDELL